MYKTEFMTKGSRKRHIGLIFSVLSSAKRDCCYRLIAGATHTRVVNVETGDNVYSNGNVGTAFYDLATWDGDTDPDEYADHLESFYQVVRGKSDKN